MKDISLAVDLDMCTGCFACQNACKMINGLGPDVKWLRVTPDYCYPEEVHGSLYMDRFPIPVTLDACASCPERVSSDTLPTCCTVCMGKALFVGTSEATAKWANGKRSVVFLPK